MPNLTWSEFVDKQHPAAHLVVAGMPGQAIPDITLIQTLLHRLVKRASPLGNYALTVLGNTGLSEDHAGFEKRLDAERIAGGGIKAQPTTRYQGWESQYYCVATPSC